MESFWTEDSKPKSEQWPWTSNLWKYYGYSKIMLAQLHTKCIFHDFRGRLWSPQLFVLANLFLHFSGPVLCNKPCTTTKKNTTRRLKARISIWPIPHDSLADSSKFWRGQRNWPEVFRIGQGSILSRRWINNKENLHF